MFVFIFGLIVIFSRKVERVIFSYFNNEVIIKYIHIWKVSELVLSIFDISYTRIICKGHQSASVNDESFRIMIMFEDHKKEIEILVSKNKKDTENKLMRIQKFIEQAKINT